MSSERSEERLEAMVAALRDRPARLDEIAQARVRIRLEAALANADVAEMRTVGRWRRRGVAAGVGLAAAAAVFAVVAAAGGGKPTTSAVATVVPPAPSGDVANDGTVASAASRATAMPLVNHATVAPLASREVGPVAGTANAAGTIASAGGSAAITTSAAVTAHDATMPVTVAAGESAQVMLGGAAVTVYGPGRLAPVPDGAVIEAAGIVVDRTHGDTPWSVRYHGVKIVATHATFAIDHGTQTRVSVIRGEIVLTCPSGSRTIRSGASATCEPAVTARLTPPVQPAASSAEQPQVPDPQPQPESVAADPYSAAESALRRGDLDAARDALLAIVDATPSSLDAATALLDLARLAAGRGDTTRALTYLDRLDRHPRRAALATPAARLRATLARSESSRARP